MTQAPIGYVEPTNPEVVDVWSLTSAQRRNLCWYWIDQARTEILEVHHNYNYTM
jgi:hypothetical protein